jgi:transcriptional regulator with XRE-family HTH domain
MIPYSSLQEATMPNVKPAKEEGKKSRIWQDWMFLPAHRDIFRMSLALMCMRINDRMKNGYVQARVAEAMGVSVSMLSKMFNFKRMVYLADVELYCKAVDKASTPSEFLVYAKTASKNAELVAAAKAFAQAKGRKDRRKTGNAFLELLKTFVHHKPQQDSRNAEPLS